MQNEDNLLPNFLQTLFTIFIYILMGVPCGFLTILIVSPNAGYERGLKEGYEKGQTDFAKNIKKFDCDTLKDGNVHCYEINKK
jgi:hypothetical protein